MSKLFFDHIINLDEVEKEVNAVASTAEERHELWKIIDEMVHHKILTTSLDHLDIKHHGDFLEKFHKAPHDESLMEYLTKKVGKNVEELLRQEIGDFAAEILDLVRKEVK